MIPVEVGSNFNQLEIYNKTSNNEQRREDLDMLLEVKEQAHLRNEKRKALIV